MSLSKAGGCLDGKQHLSLQGLGNASGMQTLAGAMGAQPSSSAGAGKGKNNKGKRRAGGQQQSRQAYSLKTGSESFHHHRLLVYAGFGLLQLRLCSV